jgi:hypothetical protein
MDYDEWYQFYLEEALAEAKEAGVALTRQDAMEHAHLMAQEEIDQQEECMSEAKHHYVVPVELRATVFFPICSESKEAAAEEAERSVAAFSVGYTTFGPAEAQAGEAFEYETAEEAVCAARKASMEAKVKA